VVLISVNRESIKSIAAVLLSSITVLTASEITFDDSALFVAIPLEILESKYLNPPSIKLSDAMLFVLLTITEITSLDLCPIASITALDFSSIFSLTTSSSFFVSIEGKFGPGPELPDVK
jgi:hypothetical protein